MSNTTIRVGAKLFYDDKNFARGFSRSGLFTVQESTKLEQYGHTLKLLLEKQIAPENEEEKQFVTRFETGALPETEIEKIWAKYLKALGPKAFYTLNSGSKNNSGISASDSSEYSLEL